MRCCMFHEDMPALSEAVEARHLHVPACIAGRPTRSDMLSPQVMRCCKMFHEDVRALSEAFRAEQGRVNYVTPTSYLELITAFTGLLGSKRAEVGALHGPAASGKRATALSGDDVAR